jgi:alpha-galactosidase
VVFNYSNPMSRICTTVKRAFPDLRLVGMCHEIAMVPLHLPRMLGTPVENLRYRAGGLNHFSVLLELHYRDSGRDAYPDVRARAVEYFRGIPDTSEVMEWLDRLKAGGTASRPGRGGTGASGLIIEILSRFGYLPVTSDSHFGEYIQWAHGVVDHHGILDFYNWYKGYCQRRREPEIKMYGYEERAVPIIDGILTDSGYEEPAVNVQNQGLIANLPAEIAVEVPATVGRNGVTGVALGRLPAGIAGCCRTRSRCTS